MTEVIPKIESLKKLSELYKKFQQTKRIIDSSTIERREYNDLENFLKLSKNYIDFADSLENSMKDTQEFRKKLIDTYENVFGAINGNINGEYSGDILNKGIIFDTKSKNEGGFKGVVNLTMTKFEKSIGVSNSSYTWLKEFLNQYTLEMNKSLESVQENKTDSRLVLSINRVNNAIKDIYSDGNAISLLYSTKNLLAGLETLESFVYKGIKNHERALSLHDTSKHYVEAVEDLRECAGNKDVFEFECTFPRGWSGGLGKYGHIMFNEEKSGEIKKIFLFLNNNKKIS